MQLSNVAVSSSKKGHPEPLSTPSPYEQSPSYTAESQTPKMSSTMAQYQPSLGNISSSFKSMRIESLNPNLVPQYQTATPSGISLLLANRRAEPLSPGSREPGQSGSLESSQPRNEPIDLSASPQTPGPKSPSLSEETPLLAHNLVPQTSYSNAEAGLPELPSKSKFRTRLVSASRDLLVTCVYSLPAVLLGVLLNILDGVSCKLSREYLVITSLTTSIGSDGLIIFPTSGIFADIGGLGVSMFFVS